MTPDQLAELRRIDAEAIATHRDKRGQVDHVAAAGYRRDELLSLEAGGHTWAAHVRDAAEMDGHRKVIKNKVKAQPGVSIPAPTGTVDMPRSYSHRDKDGVVQLTMWLHIPLDELQDIVDALTHQLEVLSDRSLAMRYGLELARKHGVKTAAEGFEAEGIDVEGLAA